MWYSPIPNTFISVANIVFQRQHIHQKSASIELKYKWTRLNGILLYYLLLCGLVDNRGYMTKWYFTLLLLCGLVDNRGHVTKMYFTLTYFCVALLTTEDT